jgi:uncharacterized protein (TIGR03545 family)
MRKNFVLFVLIPLIIVAVVVYFFIDRWVESGLEYAGESAVGAKVEIDNLSVTLSPVGLTFARLQVADAADPWKNIFETGKVQFAMNFSQLLRGKYIIETAEVNDLILGTKRTTDGSLPEGRRVAEKAATTGSTIKFADLAESALQKRIIEHPMLDPSVLRSGFNVDSLLKVVDLRSVTFIETLKVQAKAVTAQWPAAVNDIENAKQRLVAIDSSVRAINPSALKDVASIVNAINTVDQAQKGVKEIVSTVESRQTAIRSDISRIAASAGQIDDVAKEDFKRVLSLARLPDLNAMGLAEALLGKQLIANTKKYLSYVDIARAKFAAYQPKPEIEKPPRMKGQDIRFPVERAYPKFWVQNVVISGGTDRTQDTAYLYAKGQVNNVTDDQHATQLPMTVKLSGTQGGKISGTVGALFDRRKEIPNDEYKATIEGIGLSDVAIGSESFLKGKITGAQLATEVSVLVPGDKFDGSADLHFRRVGFSYAGAPANVGERLVREVLGGVTGFDVKLRGWKTDSGMDIALATNLDEQFANRVKAVLGAELTKAQADLRARVNAVIAQKRQEFEAIYNARKAQVEQQLAQYQAIVNDKISLVESKKKELEDRLEKEKKGKIDDAVKKLFKK